MRCIPEKLVMVVRDSKEYVIIESTAESRLAIRKPLSDRWLEIRNLQGDLIALQLKDRYIPETTFELKGSG